MSRTIAQAVGGAEAPVHDLYVGGRWIASEGTFARRNPARPEEVVGHSAAGQARDVAAAYAAAGEALAPWAATPAPARGEILRAAADVVHERREEIARTLTREEGKAIRDARAEVLRAVSIIRYFAGEGTQATGAVYPSAVPTTQLYAVREPIGVVCAITPWNFPIAIPAWKLAPALLYGNTVVWKPAEIASGTAALLAEALDEAGLPPGVLNLVTGRSSAIGDALLDGEGLRGVTFTGSNAVGRRIASRAAERGVKVQLELGGSNPSVVLADADLDCAASAVVRSAMIATGQRCTATSRAIVVREVLDAFLSRVVARVGELIVGDPLEDATDVGPLSSRAQFDTIASYLDAARGEGLAPLCGGEVADPAGGYFVPPTVYAGVPPTSCLAREEVFGPVMAVFEAADEAAALRLANDTPFGLSASIFTRELRAALRGVAALHAGVVHVNGESTGAEPHVPFGGMKASSLGSREQGKSAREFFTETKTVYVEQVT